jgi:hypothetical protein
MGSRCSGVASEAPPYRCLLAVAAGCGKQQQFHSGHLHIVYNDPALGVGPAIQQPLSVETRMRTFSCAVLGHPPGPARPVSARPGLEPGLAPARSCPAQPGSAPGPAPARPSPARPGLARPGPALGPPGLAPARTVPARAGQAWPGPARPGQGGPTSARPGPGWASMAAAVASSHLRALGWKPMFLFCHLGKAPATKPCWQLQATVVEPDHLSLCCSASMIYDKCSSAVFCQCLMKHPCLRSVEADLPLWQRSQAKFAQECHPQCSTVGSGGDNLPHYLLNPSL